MIRLILYNQLTTNNQQTKMYTNISKSLLAVASLAMMSDARSVKVTPDDLQNMNANDEKFEMSKAETLTIMMDYPMNAPHWELKQILGAPYSVSDEHYMCTMSSCTVAWDIKYSPSNNFDNKTTINSVLHFLDLEQSEVPVGLKITTPQRRLGAVGGLSDCSRMEEIMIESAGEPLLENIDDEIVQCEKQVQVGLVYYASFQDDNGYTFTQAKFSNLSADGIVLECSISGQESGSEWNFDELC